RRAGGATAAQALDAVERDGSARGTRTVPAPDDEEVIQALAPCCADEPLGDAVRPRGAGGEAHHSHALATEDFVECGGELGITIPEKELGRESPVLESPGQIASLLHHPLRARVVSAAGEVNATAADLNKEEDVELGHPDGVDHKEVTGEHLVGVLAYEGSPGALSAPRRWAEAMAAEDPDHGQVRAPHAELKQLAYPPARAGDQPVRVRSGQAARGAR